MASQIYIVEDHPIMREMISAYVDREHDLEVCGLAATGEEALEALAHTEADLVLIDVSLPGMSGLDLVQHLTERREDQRCLIYSGHGMASYVAIALRRGARGYVLKGRPEELPAAIRHVLAGEVYITAALRDEA